MQLQSIKASGPQLSVVIVTYNSYQDIRSCLQSLASAARHIHIQLIVIDNASEDGTVRHLETVRKQLTEQFCDVKLIFNTANVGFTRAVNQGLGLCKGQYILILNPDVVLTSETLPTLFSCLQRHEEIGVVAPQLRNPDGTIQPSCRRFPKQRDVLLTILGFAALFPHSKLFNRWQMGDFDHRSSQKVDQPQGAFLLARNRVVQSVGLLDERFQMFFSDVDWCRRVKRAGWEIYFCADTFAFHKKGHSVYRQRPRMIISSHRSFVQYFMKYEKNLSEKMVNRLIHLLLLVITLPRILFSSRRSS